MITKMDRGLRINPCFEDVDVLMQIYDRDHDNDVLIVSMHMLLGDRHDAEIMYARTADKY